MSSALLGVDLGSANLKVLELKEKKDSLVVKNLAAVKMPAGSIVDGAVLDGEPVAGVIGELVSPLKGVSKGCAVGLRGRDVVVKRIPVVWNGKGNFHENFLWSSEQYVGMRAENISLDAQIIDYDEEKGVADCVIAAALKDKVAQTIDAVKQGGLNPLVVDIEALGLVNLCTKMNGLYDHVNVIIDMGHDSTRLIFFEDGHVDMVKEIAKGGRYLTEQIAEDMDADFDKASDTLRNRDMMENDANAQASGMAFGSSLGSEIETTIDVYMEDRGKEPVDFFICGAVASVTGIVDQIEAAMGLTVELLDPFKVIDLPDNFKNIAETFGHASFAVAAGLAMRKI